MYLGLVGLTTNVMLFTAVELINSKLLNSDLFY